VTDSHRQPELFRAAVNLLFVEVCEESPLWSTGGGFKTPHALPASTYADATVGWPFASWVFSRWLDAGFLELQSSIVAAQSGEFERPSWFARVSIRPPARIILSLEDSRMILQDITRWSSRGADGGVEVVRTDAADDLHLAAWIDVLHPIDGAPPIGEDPFSAADLEYRIAVTDMTPLQRRFTFPANNDAPPEPKKS
jgi:hypothetical protein